MLDPGLARDPGPSPHRTATRTAVPRALLCGPACRASRVELCFDVGLARRDSTSALRVRYFSVSSHSSLSKLETAVVRDVTRYEKRRYFVCALWLPSLTLWLLLCHYFSVVTSLSLLLCRCFSGSLSCHYLTPERRGGGTGPDPEQPRTARRTHPDERRGEVDRI